ncbi:hypothetical protein ABPG75_002694 [Micractinium tetrahymenae]
MASEAGGLHLYSAGTPNGHKARIALAELMLPYTLHKVDLAAGARKQPDFLRLNPAGKIPVLIDRNAKVPSSGTGSPDGSFVLPESGAIMFYLADAKAGAKGASLLPADRVARTECLSWVLYQAAHLEGPTHTVVTGLVFGMPHSAETMQEAVEDMRAGFRHLDARIAQTGGWLAAGQFSIADVACISGVLFCSNLLGMDLRAEYPRLGAWLDAALARPAVRQGLKTPEPCPFLAEEADTARKQMLQAARRRLARLGLQLRAEA